MTELIIKFQGVEIGMNDRHAFCKRQACLLSFVQIDGTAMPEHAEDV